MINKNNIRLDDILERIALLLAVASVAIPPFRYLGYLLPAFALITLLGNRSISSPAPARPYILLILTGVIFSFNGNSEGLKDIFLMMTGVSIAVVGHRSSTSWKNLFIFCAIGFLVNASLKGALNIQSLTVDVTNSSSSLESGFSFVFGLLAIWALQEGKWKEFLLATLFAFLTLKRIVLIAIFICILVQFSPSFFKRLIFLPVSMVLINCTILITLLLYGSGAFDATILEWTGKSANAFGMGRKVLYSAAATEVMREPVQFILGLGPGTAYELATANLFAHAKENLHSDLIKIFIEYGAVIFILFFALLYLNADPRIRLLMLYSNVLFVTDNTLIYPFYIFFLLFISHCVATGSFSDRNLPSHNR